HRLRPRGIRELILRRRQLAAKHRSREHLSHSLSLDAERVEHHTSHRWRLRPVATGIVEQRDEQMLGADMPVAQLGCFLARLAQDRAQSIGELESVHAAGVEVRRTGYDVSEAATSRRASVTIPVHSLRPGNSANVESV